MHQELTSICGEFFDKNESCWEVMERKDDLVASFV
jgi:hypothetical protein